jgi:uncharacterized protein YjbJ (UPF0337 family)
MSLERLIGTWKQVQGKVEERVGRLTHNRNITMRGLRHQTEGMIQRHFGSNSIMGSPRVRQRRLEESRNRPY